MQQAGSHGFQGSPHPERLAVGEKTIAVEGRVVHKIARKIIDIRQKRAACRHVRRAGVEYAGRVRCLVGRGIAHAVAVDRAVVVFTAALEGVIQAEIVPHFVDQHGVFLWAFSKKPGFAEHAVLRLPVCGWEKSIAGYARTRGRAQNFPYHPDIHVSCRVPAAQIFCGDIVGFHGHHGQRRLGAGNADGGLAVGVAFGQAKLDLRIDGSALLRKIALRAEAGVQVVDGSLDLCVGDVFRTAVVNDVDDDGNGVNLRRQTFRLLAGGFFLQKKLAQALFILLNFGLAGR